MRVVGGKPGDVQHRVRVESDPASAVAIAKLLRQVGTVDGEELTDVLAHLASALGAYERLRPSAQPAVPLLMAMVEGDRTRRPAAVLRMLASLVPPVGERDLPAEADHGYAVAPPVDPMRPVVRDLLGAHLDGLLQLLRSADPHVRAATARLLAGLPAEAARSVPALTRAADREEDPVAHASMVLAVATLHRDAADDLPPVAGWLDARLAPGEDPLVRTAAAVAAAWVGTAPSRSRAVLRGAAATPPAGLTDEFVWSECGPDTFLASAFPDDRAYAVELVQAAASSGDPHRRFQALQAGWEVMRRWRAAPPAVVEVVAPLATDPSPRVRQYATHVLAVAGHATARVADLLAELVTDPGLGDREGAWPTIAESARFGLARLRDPRCLPGLRRAVVGATPAGWLAESLAAMADYAAEVLPEIDRALTEGTDAARLSAVLCGVHSWGDRIAPLADSVLRLTEHPQWTEVPGGLPGALGVLGPRAARAEPYLRRLLQHELPGVRSVAAVALWRVTGDADSAVRTLREMLSAAEPGPYLAASAAERMGAAAGPLVDEVARLLAAPVRPVRVAAARALLAVAGPSEPVQTTLAEEAAPDPVGVQAIEALVRIGPPAASVLPVLRPMAFSERRVPQCNGDLAVIRDEGWQLLARLALARIAPEDRRRADM